ncbi:MAG: hypothetical protein JWO80_3696, partial [Bryobacterales bacterium]|nr:hypothetical protein [Bryobacterales bacterium]
IDRIHADFLENRMPTRENILMSAPDADNQILSGIFARDNGQWRWMGKQASILLKSPPAPAPIHIGLYIPETVTARTVTVSLDNRALLTRTFPGPGLYSLDTVAQHPSGSSAVITIGVDKTASPPGDSRQLGIILTEVGFGK